MENNGPFDFFFVLHLYVNLKVLNIVGMEEVTDAIIRENVVAGGLRHLTEFVAVRCGNLSMNTVWLLMHNCPNLTKIGNVSSWRGVTENEVVSLLTFLKNNNLSLTVCS
jgi:hypothetical protein